MDWNVRINAREKSGVQYFNIQYRKGMDWIDYVETSSREQAISTAITLELFLCIFLRNDKEHLLCVS